MTEHIIGDLPLNQEGDYNQSAESGLDEELKIFDFSHYPMPSKSSNTLRIFYNNVNGLEINVAIEALINKAKTRTKHEFLKEVETHTKLEALMQQMYNWNTDVCVLSEPCIEWRDILPRKIVQEISRKFDKTGNWTVATSSCYSGSFVKPGGALVYSAGTVAGRILQRGTDPWGYGRWSYVQYTGTDGKSLLVIGGYRVGHRSTIPGASTAWFQQKVLLTKNERTLEPDEAFLTDLTQWLHDTRKEDMEVILFLDANEQWSEKAKITEFANEMGLLNLNLAGEYQFPATHPCLTNKDRDTTIDFCLCSHRVVECITYATMTPYDLHSLGDHRGFLIDIDFKGLLHAKKEEIYSSIGRKLSTGNPQATKRYLSFVEERFREQNIYDRAIKLYHHCHQKKHSRWAVMRKYNNLDAEIFAICRKAERQCRPTVCGHYQWSPQLTKAIKEMAYWRARAKYKDRNRLIKKLSDDIGIKYVLMSRAEIQANLYRCRAQLKQVQSQSIKHRQQHLEELAATYASANNISKLTAIKELLVHESTKRMFSIMKEKMTTSTTGQLSKLWISRNNEGNYVKDNSNKRILTKADEIHSALLKRNQRHLAQAQNTPFASGKWATDLKWDGTGDLGKDILSGDILNKTVFESTTQLYFESLITSRMSKKLKPVKPILSLEEYKAFWKKKREETATSPFGLHVGHFKAATQNNEILNVHRIMLLIPFQTALVPQRWKKTVQTMLEKDPGSPWIHRLRIIELFDSQVNAGFQIFIGRKMVWEAVKRNQLHPASFGSTPGKMAASAILQKILSNDQLKIERKAGGIFDCDATGCYDRIIPPLASVHLQALGLDSSIATFLARLMYVAKRYVKTKHGVSKSNIRTTTDYPLFGIGQGNGGGPAIWLAHLTVMFSALAAICQGFTVCCIKGIEFLRTVGTGYVDDVTLFVSIENTSPQTELQVKKKLKHMASKWEKILHLTGGKLELTKCFWVPVTWNWRHGDPVLNSPKDGQGLELRLRESESGRIVTIPRLKPNKAEKRLGIRYAFDGSWNAEYRHWLKITSDFAMRLRKARLDRASGLQAYKTLWCSKFRYCAPVVGFSDRQLLHIQTKIIGHSLAAAGYHSKMPRAVVFGPSEYGGMKWESPHSILLTAQIKLVIGSVRLNDTVGQLIGIQLQWLQVLAGTMTPILESHRLIPYLPTCWMQTLHQKLVTENIQLKLAKVWTPSPRREEDQVIMDYVIHHLPIKMWGAINQCRIFLQAIVFSDITTFDGSEVPQSVYQVKEAYRESRIAFPYQKRPPKKAIACWQYFLNHFTDDQKLYAPLGRWKETPYQNYQYHINEDSTLLYKKNGTQWEVFYHDTTTRNTYLHAGINRQSLPVNWRPIQVINCSKKVIKGIIPERIVTSPSLGGPSVGTFNDSVHKSTVGEFFINEEELNFLKAQWHHVQVSLVCGCDGGLKDCIGSRGYTVYIADRMQPLVSGYSAERLQDDTSSSTRQELWAQLCIEYWLVHFIDTLGEPQSKVEAIIITDSQASIQIRERATLVVSMKELMQPDSDVVMELAQVRVRNKHTTIKFHKVQSHIPKEDAPDEFFWQLNEEADRLATLAREKVIKGELSAQAPVFLEGAKAMCRIDGTYCTNNLGDRIYNHVYSDTLKDFLCRKYNWLQPTFNSIHWGTHQAVLDNFYGLRQVTVHKYVHGWLATNTRRYREGLASSALCDLCSVEEDSHHLFCCQNEEMKAQRKREFHHLVLQLRKITDLRTVEAITAGLVGTVDEANSVYPDEFITSRGIQQAFQDQALIGWYHFLCGRIARSWLVVGPSQDYAGSPLQWAKKAVRLVLDYGLNLWHLRNKLVHGVEGGVSRQERTRLKDIIIMLYEDLQPGIHPAHRWLFNETREAKLQESYAVQVAWVESVRQMYPGEYSELCTSTGSIAHRQAEIERHKAPRTDSLQV